MYALIPPFKLSNVETAVGIQQGVQKLNQGYQKFFFLGGPFGFPVAWG